MSNRLLLGVEDGGGGCGVEGGGMDGVVGVGGDEGGGGVEGVGRMGDDGVAMITMPLLSARMYGSDLAGCER